MPYIITSSFAGVFVDRKSKKYMLVSMDCIAAICTLVVLFLIISNKLEFWSILAVNVIIGFTNAFTSLALSILLGELSPKDGYEKISGLNSFSNSLVMSFSPMLATFVSMKFGLASVLSMDFITFAFATSVIVLIIKEPASRNAGISISKPTFISEISVGYNFLKENSGIFMMMMFLCVINFFSNLTYENILPAMILSRSNSNNVLAVVTGIIGASGILGGMYVSAFKLPKNKVREFFLAAGISFVFGDLSMAFGHSLKLWIPAAIFASFPIPIILAVYNVILYKAVPQDIQGRVFATKNAIQRASVPIALLLGGFLADYLFEPLAGSNQIFLQLFGYKSGAGMALMFKFTGIMAGLSSILFYNNKRIKMLEHLE